MNAPAPIPGEQLSFLPPQPFNPTWPTRGTLADRALGAMLNGQKIDHPAFENTTLSWRLGAVIFNLRALGWPIETINVARPTAEMPNRAIALYHLPAKYIAMALTISTGGRYEER